MKLLSKYNNGLIVGKFYPFHQGHQLLLNTALNKCLHVDMMLLYKRDEEPNYLLRKQWIEELYQKQIYLEKCLTLHIYEDNFTQKIDQLKNSVLIEKISKEAKDLKLSEIDDQESQMWAQFTLEKLGYRPNIVFTSETYGQRFCKFLKTNHYLVDLQRETIPISGTMIRNNPIKHWDYLSEPLKEYYCKRIVILGPESTGKTTLCAKLAEKYNSSWVPEYGRELSEQKLTENQSGNEEINYDWSVNDFLNIAKTQSQRENQAARESKNGIIICDTDAFATYIWGKRYLKEEIEEIMEIFFNSIKGSDKNNRLYLLSDPSGMTFVQDGTRDGEEIRKWMFDEFQRKLIKYQLNYLILENRFDQKDDYQYRYQTAGNFIDDFIK